MLNILKFKKFIIIFLLLLAGGGFVFAAEDFWPNYAGNALRNGSADNAVIPEKPKVLWQLSRNDFAKYGAKEGDRIFPIIADNRVFINFGKVFALNLENGKILWSFFDKDRPFFPAGLAFGENKIFAIANDTNNLKTMKKGTLYALSPDNGKLFWFNQTDDSISHSQPLYAKGKLFIGDDSGKVYAFSTTDGQLLWKAQLEAEVIHSSPAFYNNHVYIGTEGSAITKEQPSSVYCLDAETGKTIWRYQIDYEKNGTNLIHATPAIYQGVVYIGSENGWFYALKADNGKLIWKNRLVKEGGRNRMLGSSAPAAIKNNKVFVVTWDNKFFALEAQSGGILWQYTFEGEGSDSAPIADKNKVCFGAHEGNFQCLDQENGQVIWKEGFGNVNAAIAGKILIVFSPLDNGSKQTILFALSSQGKYNISEKAKNEKIGSSISALPNYLKYIFTAIIVLAIIIFILLIKEKLKKKA